jgi:hypothetical protein
MDKKKVLLIGTGIVAFGVVVYFVIKKFRGGNTSGTNKCPEGYMPRNGKCARLTTTGGGSTPPTNQSGVYTGYYGETYEYTGYYGGYDGGGNTTTTNTNTSGGWGTTNYVITRSGSRLRKEPNTNSTIIKTYDKGVTLAIVDESEKSDGLWYKVQEKSGVNATDVKREGWMRSDVVDIALS